jgi:hypothetical protein
MNAPITLHAPELELSNCGDALAALARWARRPERVRNIVDVPLLPDEMSQANDERRRRRKEKRA